METDAGRSLRDGLVELRSEPASGLGRSATIPSAGYLSLVEQLETADAGSPMLDAAIGELMMQRGFDPLDCMDKFTRSLDSALRLLPKGADWRKLTNPSISVYAANPYNAEAQKRHDGNGATPPLQMCAAALRLMADPLIKAEKDAARRASAIEARRAETGTGSVYESAVGNAETPKTTPENQHNG